MITTSEWVSLGHPDKVADFISCYLLDRYLERDPMTRFAVEVQIKDHFVTLGGEITSEAHFSDDEIRGFVKNAVREVGYSPYYQSQWDKENAISSEDLEITLHLGSQSPDIAQGVAHGGQGDQGIFHAMAVNDPATDYMPKDYFLAKTIGMELYQSGGGGIDIKTQVTMDDDKVIQVIVAIPLLECDDRAQVENIVHKIAGDVPEIIINGTGRFVTHGPIGDCGTTGRKLAVDFYGGNCKIGGGSPWTKDASKADLTLNIYARYKAREYLKAHGLNVVYCSISCCIGRREIRVSLFDQANQLLKTYCESPMPEELITKFHLREPRFARMCRDGLLVDL